MSHKSVKVLALVGGLAAVSAFAADGALQKVDAGGMTFEVPSSWKSSKPSNPMRKAQLSIKPAQGDSEAAEVTVFGFPSTPDTVDTNIKRWEGQFRDKNGQSPKAKTEKVKGGNIEVVRVELAGEFRDPFARDKSAHSDYRLLGAIADSKSGTAYFIKLVGPGKTVAAAKSDFDKMLGTITVE
jgi:hypothetical protein